MIDSLAGAARRGAHDRQPSSALGLSPAEFVLATLHRPALVDDDELLARTLEALGRWPIACRWCSRSTRGRERAWRSTASLRARGLRAHRAARLSRLHRARVRRAPGRHGFGRCPGGNDRARRPLSHLSHHDRAPGDDHEWHESARGRRPGPPSQRLRRGCSSAPYPQPAPQIPLWDGQAGTGPSARSLPFSESRRRSRPAAPRERDAMTLHESSEPRADASSSPAAPASSARISSTRCVARGDRVTVLDDLSTGRRENVAHLLGIAGVELVEGSTIDAELVDELVARRRRLLPPRLGGRRAARRRPTRWSRCSRTSAAPTTCCRAAARHGKRLLFTSTSEVYGKNSSGALDEDSDRVLGSPFKSRWCYAIAKGFGECARPRLPPRPRARRSIVVRLFNTVGPRQTGRYGMVLPRFVRQALDGERPHRLRQRHARRAASPTSHDTVRAHPRAARRRPAPSATSSTSARSDEIADHRARAPGDRAHRLGLEDRARALRRGLRRRLRGARPPQARHHARSAS